MIENLDIALVNWSRGQFALVAFFHWLFVPLTIGLIYIVAFAQTIYVKTGDPAWEKIAKFWAKLFGINFAFGVGTGIILGVELGSNWANFSWIAGDIFAPHLAFEGIMAFFLEATFIAVMFFGWGKVNKKFHLASIYLVALGASTSALWILVANAWMSYPVGMEFNPVTARFEMVDFFAVLLSPFAVNKFLHTMASAFTIASFFVIAISCWYLLKNRNILFAKRSLILASVFGLLSSTFVAVTGDSSAHNIAQHQPVKFASMEGLYKGEEGAGLVTFGILTPNKNPGDGKDAFIFKHHIPKLLSWLGYRDAQAFVPGIDDLVFGNDKHNIISAQEKMDIGKIAIQNLASYKIAKENNDTEKMDYYLAEFRKHQHFMGYGHFDDPGQIVPNVGFVFYSFRFMVIIGLFLIIFAILTLVLTIKNKIDKFRWILKFGILGFPLAFIASMLGWIVAEMGRQPWTIQGFLSTSVSASNISSSAVFFTFVAYAAVLLTLVIVNYKIMINTVKNGPDNKIGGGSHV